MITAWHETALLPRIVHIRRAFDVRQRTTTTITRPHRSINVVYNLHLVEHRKRRRESGGWAAAGARSTGACWALRDHGVLIGQNFQMCLFIVLNSWLVIREANTPSREMGCNFKRHWKRYFLRGPGLGHRHSAVGEGLSHQCFYVKWKMRVRIPKQVSPIQGIQFQRWLTSQLKFSFMEAKLFLAGCLCSNQCCFMSFLLPKRVLRFRIWPISGPGLSRTNQFVTKSE